ncbi:MAG: PEP-CTERM sorting domain-containing protein, partial [Verrucomicrobiaceae bacterium]
MGNQVSLIGASLSYQALQPPMTGKRSGPALSGMESTNGCNRSLQDKNRHGWNFRHEISNLEKTGAVGGGGDGQGFPAGEIRGFVVQLNPVPEPSTWLMLLAGLASL